MLIAAATAADIFTIDYPDRKGISGGYIFPCVAAVVLGAVGAGLVAGAGRLLAISVGGPGRRWAPLWGIVNGALAFLAAWVGSAIAPLGRGSVGSSLVGAGGFAASYTGSSLALVMLKRRLVGGPGDYPRLDVVTNALLLPLALGLVVAYLRDGTNALVLAAAFLVALLVIVRTSVNLKTANGELQRAYGDLDQQRDELTAALGLNREYGRVFSHDLRGQLTAITGNAELAVRGLARPGTSLQDQARHLDRILHNGRRMVRLIDSLGLLSRTEQDSASLELTPLDAAAVVTQVTDDLRPAAEDRGTASICASRARTASSSPVSGCCERSSTTCCPTPSNTPPREATCGLGWIGRRLVCGWKSRMTAWASVGRTSRKSSHTSSVPAPAESKRCREQDWGWR